MDRLRRGPPPADPRLAPTLVVDVHNLAYAVAPVELADLTLCPGTGPLAVRLRAPRAPTSAELVVGSIPMYVELERPLVFEIVPRYPAARMEDVVAFTSTVIQHLHVSASISSSPTPSPKLAYTVVSEPKPSMPARVCVAVATPRHTSPCTVSLSLQALTLAGCTVPLSALPTVRIGINHEPAKGRRLWEAASAGDAVGVASALAAGSSTEETKRGRSALFVAVTEGHAEVVRVLLSAGADPHKDTGYLHLLHWARTGDVIDALLEDPRVDINAYNDAGYTALHGSIRLDDTSVLRRLLADQRLNPNLRLASGAERRVGSASGTTALADAEERLVDDRLRGGNPRYAQVAAEMVALLRTDPRVAAAHHWGRGGRGEGGGGGARR